MAETAARGAEIQISNGASTPVFTEITGVSSGPDFGGFSQKFIEQAIHSNTIDRVKNIGVTLNAVTFEMLYDSTNTQHSQLRDAAEDSSLVDIRVILTDDGAEQVAFSAWVDFSFNANPEDFNRASISLRPDPDAGFVFS